MLTRELLKLTLPIFICFLVTACDKPRQEHHFPGTIVSMQGFTEDQSQEVLEAIEALNDEANRELISTSEVNFSHTVGLASISAAQAAPSSNNYPVTIILGNPEAEKPSRVGLARVSDTSCVIELSKKLFQLSHDGFFKTVVWHELRHCDGAGHVAEEEEVMSEVAIAFYQLTREAIDRFIESFL